MSRLGVRDLGGFTLLLDSPSLMAADDFQNAEPLNFVEFSAIFCFLRKQNNLIFVAGVNVLDCHVSCCVHRSYLSPCGSLLSFTPEIILTGNILLQLFGVVNTFVHKKFKLVLRY